MAELVEHLAEENAEPTEVEGFGLVHAATKDLGVIPQEVLDSLDNCPGAHVGRDAFLVSKLEVIEAEDVTEEVDGDPVYLLEDQGRYAD